MLLFWWGMVSALQMVNHDVDKRQVRRKQILNTVNDVLGGAGGFIASRLGGDGQGRVV